MLPKKDTPRMRWPNPTDYQDAVQNPKFCFQDPELKAGTPALLPMGLPRVASGNFASVYEIHNGRKRWAVRCFLRQAADQQRHYTHVSEHLQNLWLPFLVDFQYQAQGIRVLGQTYPIVKMQWVDGIALHSFVKKRLKRPQNLLKLAAQWRGIVNSLYGSRLAHGDLQHGNVLVTSKGQIRLVDYDAMYVPALHGTNCAELGHANYQHPQRTGANYDHHLDNFSALVIYTSLRALAVEPDLWQEFHTGENLIFSAADFKNPSHSDVFQRLRSAVPTPEVQAYAAELEKWCCGTFAQIGNFESVLSAPRPAAPPNTPVPSSPPPTKPASQAPPSQPNRWWLNAATTAPPSTLNKRSECRFADTQRSRKYMTTALQRQETELLTYERYVQDFMNERPILQPYAIIEGVRYPMNSPLLIHQIVQLNIGELFRHSQRATGTGLTVVAPFDVVIRQLPRLQVRQPDVLFITRDRIEQAGGIMMEGPLTVPPQIVVKILSPSETASIVRDKIEDFRRIGVEEAWLVSSQAETVQILRLSADGMETVAIYANGQTLQSRVFPDMTFALADIFVL